MDNTLVLVVDMTNDTSGRYIFNKGDRIAVESGNRVFEFEYYPHDGDGELTLDGIGIRILEREER